MRTLAAVDRLLSTLDERKLEYVHWKSNDALARSADGRNDLDLLVEEASSERFEAALRDVGFLPAIAAPRARVPGISDYYGLDLESPRLVHVHAHSRLVLGDDATKNYTFPFESMFLHSRVRHTPFWVPSVEWEYVVFVSRMLLKHCPPDVIVGRRGRLTPSEKRELEHLEQRIDRDVVSALRAEHLPEISADLWSLGRKAIEPDSTALTRSMAGLRFQRAVARHGRRGPVRETLVRNWRRSTDGFLRRHPRHQPKRVPKTGGLLVSLVGSDGSGKSTAVAGISEMFEQDLWVVKAHLGKPPPSFARRLLRRLARVVLEPDRRARLSLPAWDTPSDEQDLVFALWHLAIARDRWREVRRLRGCVERGALVVADRFPNAGLATMDCPRIEPGVSNSRARHLLARLEKRYYAQMGDPDLMLVLLVDPDTAVARSGQDPDFVFRRADEVATTDWSSERVVVLDAERGAEDVRAEALATVWSRLMADRSSRPT